MLIAPQEKINISKTSKEEARAFIKNALKRRCPHMSETELNGTCNKLLKKAFKGLQQKQERQQQRKMCDTSKNTQKKKERSAYYVISPSPNKQFIKYYLNQGPKSKVSQEYVERMLWTMHKLCCIRKLIKPKKKKKIRNLIGTKYSKKA